MANWKFKPYSSDDMGEDPIEGEFFTTNEVGSISNAIVREGIQNALDEWVKELRQTPNRSYDNQVRIRIFLSGEKYKLPRNEYDSLLSDLLPHLIEKESGMRDLPNFDDGMKFLVFEDFNTNGLEGDPEEIISKHNKKKGVPHNFFWFWRNVGRSGKSDEKLGRWGLGKTVFPASSRINTFWGITITKNNKDSPLLMGQSILKSHNIGSGEELYKPYGFYGEYKNNQNYFASPVENKEIISNFETKFKLKRKNNTGLSIIVPFVTDEITFEGIIYSVVEQYFFPILLSNLSVEVVLEDKNISVSASTIRNITSDIDYNNLENKEKLRINSKESFGKLFDFADWINKLDDNKLIKLNEPAIANVPMWREALFNKGIFEKLTDKYEKGERLAFLVPLKYHPKDDIGEIRWFKAFLEKDDSLQYPENHFIRNGITITGITSLVTPGVRGIVIVDDDKLAKMIGDAENPAHTEIQKDSKNFKDKYHDGDKCLTFFKNSLQRIFLQLQKPAIGIDKDFLKDYFYIPKENPVEKEEIEPDDDSTKPPDDDSSDTAQLDFPAKNTPRLNVIKLNGGFRISFNEKAVYSSSIEANVVLGYMVSRGNPITSYEQFDFEMDKSPIRIKSKGVNFLAKKLNEISFQILSKDFEIEAMGFDPNRDLVIKTKSYINL